MSKKSAYLLGAGIVLVLFAGAWFFAPLQNANAGNLDNVSGWAWSDNIGWISFNCTTDTSSCAKDYGVTIDTDTGELSGYAWSDNIGWISFNRLDTGVPPEEPYNGAEDFIACLDTAAAGESCDNGDNNKLYGWARALANDSSWDGWIKLRGTSVLTSEPVEESPSPASPIGYWAMEDESGQVVTDLSGQGNHGTLGGTSLPPDPDIDDPEWTLGAPGSGGALEFNDDGDGGNESVKIGNPEILQLTGAMTVSAWINITDYGGPSADYKFYNSRIVTKSGIPGLRGWDLNLEGADCPTWPCTSAKVHFHLSSDGSSQARVISEPIPLQEWVHVMGVYEPGVALRMYINGELSNETTSGIPSTQFDSGNNVFIGSRAGCSNCFFNGKIDEVKIYNQALGAVQVSSAYSDSSLFAHYKLDEGVGIRTYDSVTASLNSGLLVNMDDSDWVAGVDDTALDFDGSNEHVVIADFDPPQEGTVAFWMKPDTIPSGSNRKRMIGGHDAFELMLEGNKFQNQLFAASSADLESNATFSPNQWYHIVATYDFTGTNRLEIYINGVLDAANTSANDDPGGPFTLYFGRSTSSSDYFDGQLDDIRVYDRVLSGTEISNLYAKPPVAHFRLDTGSGTTAFDSVGGSNGTLTSMDPGTDWVLGRVGPYALNFDGNDDHVRVASSDSLNITGNLTVATWVKFDDVSGRRDILGKWGTGGARQYLLIMDAPFGGGEAQKMQFWVGNSGGSLFQTTPSITTFQANTWYHIAGVYDGSNLKLYVNGLLEVTMNIGSQTLDSSNEFFGIGDISDSNGANVDGTIDDVRLYGRALSAAEIGEISLEFPIAHYKMEDVPGQIVVDTSSKGSHGIRGYTLTSEVHDPEWTLGKAGNGGALDFDGNDAVVVTSAPNLLLNEHWSVLVWVEPQTLANEKAVLWKGSYLSTDTGYGLLTHADGSWDWGEHDGSWTNTVGGSAGSLENGEWALLTVTYDGTNVRTYTNGVLVTTAAKNTVTPESAPLYIGASDDLTYFIGKIDDLRIYGRALSNQEIRDVYDANAPVSHWKLDETSGTTAFDSVGGNDGMLTNMDENTDWVLGIDGNALEFEGGDEYVSASLAGSPIANTMSLGAWINIKTLGVQHNVVSLGSAGGNRVSLYVSSGNVIQCWDNGNDLSSGVTISADTWYHVACTYDGTTKRIYVDGDEKDSAASTFGFTANNVVIGADITPTSFNTDGFIDDVFIYDRALSPEEVESTGSHYGVAWNGTDEFEGWAWGSDVLGWVAFNNKLGAGFAHGGAEHAVKFGGSTNAPTAVITCSQSPCETWLESTVLGNRLNPILTLINSSTDPEGDIITSTFTATDPAPLTQWASCAGTCNHTLQPVHPVSSYTVELRVEDSTGLSDTVVLGEEIKIRQGVIASFECSLDNSLYVDCSMIFPPANTVIYVKNTSTFSEIGTSIDGCDWTFEDANPASVSDPLCANVPVTFLSGGPKSVTLFATDDALKVGSTAETINTLLPFPEWKEVSPF